MFTEWYAVPGMHQVCGLQYTWYCRCYTGCVIPGTVGAAMPCLLCWRNGHAWLSKVYFVLVGYCVQYNASRLPGYIPDNEQNSHVFATRVCTAEGTTRVHTRVWWKQPGLVPEYDKNNQVWYPSMPKTSRFGTRTRVHTRVYEQNNNQVLVPGYAPPSISCASKVKTD